MLGHQPNHTPDIRPLVVYWEVITIFHPGTVFVPALLSSSPIMNTLNAIQRLRQVLRRQPKAISTESSYVYWLRLVRPGRGCQPVTLPLLRLVARLAWVRGRSSCSAWSVRNVVCASVSSALKVVLGSNPVKTSNGWVSRSNWVANVTWECYAGSGGVWREHQSMISAEREDFLLD